VVSGLTEPLAFVQDPTDASVRFIAQKGGRIRVLKNGLLQSADFLNLTGIVSTTSERGLLGLAFPPDYVSSRRFYVNFTNSSGHTVIARFKRSTSNPLAADPGTRFDLRWPGGERYIAQPFANHNGAPCDSARTATCMSA
jgi:glucose/arabinose dehydrogenase